MSRQFTLGEALSPTTRAGLVGRAQQQRPPWLQFDPAVMRASYNRQPFLLKHRLAEHPHFELASLFALCRRMETEQVSCRIGKVPVDTEFDSSLQRYGQGLTLDDTIEHFEARQAYIAIYNPERDAEYRPVIEELVGEVASQTESVEPGMTGTPPTSSSRRRTRSRRTTWTAR